MRRSSTYPWFFCRGAETFAWMKVDMRRGNTTIERDAQQRDKRSDTEARPGSVTRDLRLLMCACGALVDDEEDLLDHQGWCQGDAQANQALIACVRQTAGEVSYEQLVAAANHLIQQRQPRADG
jgi:hypothetical protein